MAVTTSREIEDLIVQARPDMGEAYALLHALHVALKRRYGEEEIDEALQQIDDAADECAKAFDRIDFQTIGEAAQQAARSVA